jgi:hypothetical protein
MLRDQQARKLDIVAPATAIRARGGQLVLDGTDPQLGPDGVTMTTGTYTPTELLASGSDDRTVRLWDLVTGEQVCPDDERRVWDSNPR